MSRPRRVLVAGLFHETHTFVDDLTTLSAFEFRLGDALLECLGDASPLGGALEVARELGWQIEPLLDARAVPSGTVEDAVFEEYWRGFRDRAHELDAARFDGLLLILHGAMVTVSCRDVEGELLRRIREELGWTKLPVVAVLDLHANVSPLMAQHASALIAYRENPHADARETACRAARLLDWQMHSGTPIETAWRGTPIVWPPAGTGTAFSPMAELEAMARAFEQETPGVLAVNVCAGFSFADTRDTGVSFSLVKHADGTSGETILESLAAKAWELREAGNVRGIPVDEVLEKIEHAPAGLIVLAEESDNIGGGAPGDGTGLLRALVAHRIENAAVCLADAEAVRQLADVPIGGRSTQALGGRGSRYDAGPLAIEVTVRRRTDGRFVLEDKQSHLASVAGDSFDMGPSVLGDHHGILILLTSRRTPPMDLGQWTSVGVDPANLRVMGVKAAIAHRRAYDPIAAANYLIDTPGPCSGDLRRLDFRHIRRPVFPLDPFPNHEPSPSLLSA
ncbi:MAG: M81 family metallopeptidase [Chthoniobacteraceae bacterium]